MMDAGTAVGTAVLGQGSPSICCGGREEEQEGEEAERGGGASQSTACSSGAELVITSGGPSFVQSPCALAGDAESAPPRHEN